ncbi:hypothetical protein LMG31506_02703 [Cupriavidus yeoncheonensis]|uniref:Uncharacterized protein n=1 Tax=Cupriavidus yeoncheonensis TaxID=1462994 RepID=A0A916ISP8_9BURK|nr:hypothetical protein [Cupriavidus yeoncheonensis]CAG2142774.1 hypothetical protein LMG31506_02703 [Cupriavidus yeoncheonensis]
MPDTYRSAFARYGRTDLPPCEHEVGGLIGTDPKTGTRVFVLAAFETQFAPDSGFRVVDDDLRKWGTWEKSEQGQQFAYDLTVARDEGLPVHVFLALKVGPRRHTFELLRDGARILVGKVTHWDGQRYRIELE